METFYVWDVSESVCALKPDWKTDNTDDGIWGFFVENQEGMCGYPEMKYVTLTTDDSMDPVSIDGPDG